MKVYRHFGRAYDLSHFPAAHDERLGPNEEALYHELLSDIGFENWRSSDGETEERNKVVGEEVREHDGV